METLKSPLFISCSLLFLVHQVLQHFLGISIPPADHYLDTLLAMPIILSLLLAERRHLFRRGPSYQLSLLEIVLATFYVSAVSEWLFPLLSTRFTFDTLDFLFFFAGAGIFFLVHNRAEAKQAESGRPH